MGKPLFSQHDLRMVFENVRNGLREQVTQIPDSQFLSSSPEQICDHLYSKIHLAHLTIYEDRIEQKLTQEMIETRDNFRYNLRHGEAIQVPALKLTATIPYAGPPELWGVRPSMFTMSPPSGHVKEPNLKTGIGTLILTTTIDAQTEQPERLQESIRSTLEQVLKYTASQKSNIDQFNKELPGLISEHVAWRRKNYERYFAAAEKLRLPINIKSDAPPLKPIAIEKRIIKPLPPATTTSNVPPEPGIADQTYEHILQAIRNQGRQFERTPTTYSKHDEEELRDILWGNLSTHFGKDVNGEAFSRNGKTDIRIEADDRAAFIAECKVWRGAKELEAAVNQLLGYLRWRDCKTALVVFNKDRANFSNLLDKAPTALRGARLFRGDVSTRPEAGESRMVFASQDDDSRRITVHLFLFDLCVSTR